MNDEVKEVEEVEEVEAADDMVAEGVAEEAEPEASESEASEPEAPAPVSHGIQNLLEVLDAAELSTKLVGKILADGRVSLKDAIHFVDAFKDIDVYVAAVKDADKLDDEVKDLSQAELMQLGVRVYQLAKEVVATVKNAKK